MVGWMEGARGAGGTCTMAPSIFLSFKPPHSLSQGLTEDLHPKQDYPAWLKETLLSSTPGHHSIITACKHSCSPAGSGKAYLFLGINRK